MRPGYLSEVFASFQGEGLHIGRRHLFVRFAGCNLRCSYCDTPESLERVPSYAVWHAAGAPVWGRNPLSPKELTTLVSPLFEIGAPIDGVAVTGGEPLLQSQFLLDWLSEARFGVPVLLETSGVLPEALESVIEHVDIVSMDLKLPSNTGERAFWEEHDAFARIALHKQLYAKVLVDYRSDPDELESAARLVAALPRSIPLFLQPITDEEGRLQIGGDQIGAFYSLARRHAPDVRIVPQVHKFLGWR